jgi:hypothetical protein
MKGLRYLRLLLILLMLTMRGAAQAQEEGLLVQALPSAGRSLGDFLPQGWTVEQEVHGDLNGDGGTDIAAILIQDNPQLDASGAPNERQRGLIVLLRHEPNTLIRVGTNQTLLQCTTCGGMKEGVAIDIKKGVMIVGQMSGSREFTDETWRFRYDAQTRRLLLIGRDIENGDSGLGTGKVESCNYLTGLQITETYRYDQKGDRKITVSTKRGKCSKKTVFIEDVKGAY